MDTGNSEGVKGLRQNSQRCKRVLRHMLEPAHFLRRIVNLRRLLHCVSRAWRPVYVF